MCDKLYRHKRNLDRHVKEKHSNLKHYKCVEEFCTSKFIRRGYLLDHLNSVHGYPRAEARTLTLSAKREDVVKLNTYYEPLSSSDDDIFDMIAEQEEYLQEHRKAVDNFNLDMLTSTYDDISSPDVSIYPDDSDVNVQTSDNTSGDDANVDVNVPDTVISKMDVSIHPAESDYVNDIDNDSHIGDNSENVIVISDVSDDELFPVVTESGKCLSVERRSLRTEVEVWTRTGIRFTTYSGNEPLFRWARYEDDFYNYTMKQ
ncbi:hypothetical protein DPMN_177367 [Dreissena polymorpha]|uniref:C2H2-type domain-containing protein n=1 Tax=Dreissena polymorpha TaxID=45954 RepID=A0A9D4IKH2_DREPO|nr:hypothetical protein DPMN_177367 [Dreissena polymorpha]